MLGVLPGGDMLRTQSGKMLPATVNALNRVAVRLYLRK
jgi:hypothetical protein